MKEIPIRNLYFLLCYAWRRMDEGVLNLVGLDDFDSLENLFAQVLVSGVERLMKRGIGRSYADSTQELRMPRGRLHVAETVKTCSLARSTIVCTLSEFSVDTTANRILKQTLRQLSRVCGLDNSLRGKLYECLRRFGDVSDVPLTPALFSQLQHYRDSGLYPFLMGVCRLVYDYSSVDKGTGNIKFRDLRRDEQFMWSVYQQFVFNFLRQHAVGWTVRAETIKWPAGGSEEDLAYLPGMRTDVCARKGGLLIVIDAKYYLKTLQKFRNRETIHSEHLFQLHSYLTSFLTRDPFVETAGLLLYPRTDRDLDLRYEFSSHEVRVRTLDLAADWRSISDSLLAVLE